jgi:hypothetical protein
MNYFSCFGIDQNGLAAYDKEIRSSIEFTLKTKNLAGNSVNLNFDEKMLESIESQLRQSIMSRVENPDLRKSLKNREYKILVNSIAEKPPL